MMENVLTVAGSDSLSGGGIEADLKTFEELNVFGLSALTNIAVITNDNVMLNQVDSQLIKQQLDSIFSHMPIHFLKTGLIGDLSALKTITAKLREYPDINVVIDPVLVFKEGKNPIQKDYLEYFQKNLLPLGYVVTPNLDEAAQLSGMDEIKNQTDMILAAKKIQELGCQNVVIKGGSRLSGDLAIDFLRLGDNEYWLKSNKINKQTIDGAGCTFSAAITAQLANGMSLFDAINFSKRFVHLGIEHGIVINSQLGNVWQGAYRKRR